jgi:lipid II:glycine glycyltransferase (peptidoglycan interpeptide bridge formation enzyme)
MDCVFLEQKKSDIAAWDKFVLNSSYGSIHQISDWKNFQEHIPGRGEVRAFGVKKKSKICATVLCVKMETGIAGTYWWYSPRGPVFDPQRESETGNFLLQETEKKLRETEGLFWRIDPYFSEKQVADLEMKNFFLSVQQYQPTDTLEIDLRKKDDQIRTEMKRKGRYNITFARKKGVKIIALCGEKITPKDREDFWKLTTETTSRDNFSGHEKQYYDRFLTYLKNYAVLFFAEYDQQRIAAAISTFCGKKAIYYFGSSTSNPSFRNLMAPYLLQWEMIQYAKKRGCLSYDFLGIAPENSSHHPYAGISAFKWKFGGARRTYASGREKAFRPFWYVLYRLAKKFL